MGWHYRALLSLVVVGIFSASIFGRKASADQAVLSIQYVQVTNLTERSFVVTWTTDQTVASGSILYGTSADSLISLVPEALGPRGDVHRVFVQPAAQLGATIYFDVKSGSVVDNNGGSHYRVTLGQSLGVYPLSVTVTGRVLRSDGRTPAYGALVTAWAIDYGGLDGVAAGSAATSLPLSALTDSGGNWSLSLQTRTLDGSAFFKYTMNGTDQIKYSVAGGGLGQTPATILPLALSTSSQVTLPAVSLIGSSTTVTPSQTATNGPVATITRSATITLTPPTSPTSLATASATPTLVDTPTSTTEEIPTVQPADTAEPDQSIPPTPTDVPTRPSFPTAVPTPVLRAVFSPTARAPLVQPNVPNLVSAPPSPSAPPPAPATLVPRPALTEGAGAWPDRSTATATPSPAGTATPGSGSAGSDGGGGAESTAGTLPAGVNLLLILGASIVGLGSVGIVLGVVEARRTA